MVAAPKQTGAPEAPAGPPRYRRAASAEPQAVSDLRREVVAFAETLGADEAALEAIRLSVSEAVTNAVVHAYVGQTAGAVTVEAWLDADHDLQIVVSDEGRGMVPRVDSPGLGLGFSLMAQMADVVNVTNRHNAPGTTVSLRFVLKTSD